MRSEKDVSESGKEWARKLIQCGIQSCTNVTRRAVVMSKEDQVVRLPWPWNYSVHNSPSYIFERAIRRQAEASSQLKTGSDFSEIKKENLPVRRSHLGNEFGETKQTHIGLSAQYLNLQVKIIVYGIVTKSRECQYIQRVVGVHKNLYFTC